MRLLEKKTVATLVQNERRQLIDQGVKLARSVDALREAKAEEQSQLETFRTETVAIIQTEIDSLIWKREQLREELVELEAERILLKLPLDPEWEKIRESYLQYHESVEALEAAKETVARQLGENAMIAHDLEIERGKLKLLILTTEENYGNSALLLKKSKEEVVEQRNLAQAVLSSAELREKVVGLREKVFEEEQERVSRETERLERLEIDISNRERALADRYATLERTIKRLKKK